MIYYTDMILIPGDGVPAGLKHALADSRMTRLAMEARTPDVVVSMSKLNNDYDALAVQIRNLMNAKDSTVDWETGGAWGGPGGSSEAWGIVKNEPVVAVPVGVADDSPVMVEVRDIEPGDMGVAYDFLSDMGHGQGRDGAKWEVRHISDEGDTGLFAISWGVDEDWEQEAPEPDFDDYDY